MCNDSSQQRENNHGTVFGGYCAIRNCFDYAPNGLCWEHHKKVPRYIKQALYLHLYCWAYDPDPALRGEIQLLVGLANAAFEDGVSETGPLPEKRMEQVSLEDKRS